MKAMTREKILLKAEQALKRGTLSRLYRLLERYGNADAILRDAISELKDHCIFSHGGLALTPKYLFDFSGREKAVVPLESALWVFRLQDMKYSFRADRDVMHYSMRIYTITGDTFILKDQKKADLDAIEDLLTERYPNFFYGYSEEHDRMVHYLLRENEKELTELKKAKRNKKA